MSGYREGQITMEMVRAAEVPRWLCGPARFWVSTGRWVANHVPSFSGAVEFYSHRPEYAYGSNMPVRDYECWYGPLRSDIEIGRGDGDA